MMNRSVLRQGNLFSLKHTAQSIDIFCCGSPFRSYANHTTITGTIPVPA